MNSSRHYLLGISVFAAVALAAADPASVSAAINCSVTKIELPDAFAGHQLLVSDNGQDATRKATFSSTNPAVAKVDAKGYVTAAGNGSAAIRISSGADSLEVPVTVKGFGTGRSVDFRTEIVPILSKHGCNAGGCHGKASGQNGFKLSLFGFDTDFDYAAITREARGRRIFSSSPGHSLLLMKASGQMPHGGGKRLPAESAD
ncbi:MAG TPA: Ig-like domain-containing protein, partial [Gemmataceae bacterium]|nr:Ig-like domain-containing protein [Gemmataceae bacterium]